MCFNKDSKEQILIYIQFNYSFSADLAETERQWREEFYSWKYTDMEDWRDAFEKYQKAANKLNWYLLTASTQLLSAGCLFIFNLI